MKTVLGALCALVMSAAVQAQAPIEPEREQMVTVVTDSWRDIQGELQRFERKQGEQWQAVGEAFPVVIGRTGLAWGIGLHPMQAGIQKVEGDGKAPAGIFELGTAFGYLNDVETGLDYKAADAGDYCIDVKGSPFYNQLVNTSEVGEKAVEGSSEALRRDIHSDDHLYKKGIFVAHNPENISGSGSCIFLHLWRADDKPTAGCTAMDEADMDTLLAWLDKDKAPIMVIMPRLEYAMKQSQWQLPSLANK